MCWHKDALALSAEFTPATINTTDATINTVYSAQDGSLWVGGNGIIYRSLNHGASWERSSWTNSQITSFLKVGARLYLGSNYPYPGLWFSDDNGATLNQIDNVDSVTLLIFNQDHIYAINHTYLYVVSMDGSLVGDPVYLAVNWSPLYVTGAAVLDNKLYLSSYNSSYADASGIFQFDLGTLSTIRKYIWMTAITAGVSQLAVSTYSYDPYRTGILAGTPDILANPPNAQTYATGSMVQSLAYGGVFVAAADNAYSSGHTGVLYSIDGIHWNVSSHTDPTRYITYGNGIYLAIGDGGVFKSYDAVTWVNCNSGCAPPLELGNVTNSGWGAYDIPTNTFPVTLTASPTGGDGNYVYAWSIGGTDPSLVLNVIAGQTQSGTVSISSNGNTETQSWSVTAPPAPTGFPKHPVILVHGLGGVPGDWEGVGITSNLELQGYTINSIREFPYGFVNGKYNYQGDLSLIAQNFVSEVLTDSQHFSNIGGDGQVDIVAHSMGGVVTRQALESSPSAALKVRKFIEIGVPNTGSLLAEYAVPDKNTLLVSFLSNPILTALREWMLPTIVNAFGANNNGQPIDINSPAVQELRSGSNFLTQLNSQSSPNNIQYYSLFGDEKVRLHQKLFFIDLDKEFSFGDFVVDTASASSIPGVTPTLTAYNETPQIDLHLLRSSFAAEYTFVGNPTQMSYFHLNLLHQSNIQQKIGDILGSQ